jgi:hypothetical protein
MLAIDRWRNWRPPVEKFEESLKHEPSKPPKPEFEGFEGSISWPASNFFDGQDYGASTKIAGPGAAPARPMPTTIASADPTSVGEIDLPAGVRLIRWVPATAPVHLSRFETVTHLDIFVRTTLAQLDARLHGKTWLAGNRTLSTLLARLEACGCIVALDDPKKVLQ